MKNEGDAHLGKLGHAKASERCAAAKALGELAKSGAKDERWLAPLVKCLDDADGEVRHAASTALGWLSHRSSLIEPGAIDVLIRRLDDDVPLVRHDAAWILETFVKKKIVDRRAVPLLARNMAHADADVRAASIYCLGHFARAGEVPSAVLAEVERCADDPEEGVRDAVKTALATAAAKKS
jgi:HEAT repeat protein